MTEKPKYKHGECPTCHKVLRGDTAFRLHRVGPICITRIIGGVTHYYRSKERRCMTDAEMIDAGLEYKGGRWGFAASEESRAYFEKLRQAKEDVEVEG